MAAVPGTNVAGPLAPFDSNDTYPTHSDEYGLGGWRSVDTMAALNDIPLTRRKAGMVVRVYADEDAANNAAWELQVDGSWVKLATAGSGGLELQVDGVKVADSAAGLNLEGFEVTSEPSAPAIFRIKQASITGSGQLQVQDSPNIEVAAAPGSQVDVLAYTPTKPGNNVMVYALEIKLATLGGGSYSYEVWMGNPATTGRRVYDGLLGGIVTAYNHSMPQTLLAMASAGNTELWVRFIQQGSFKILANMRIVAEEFEKTIQELPGYVTPPPYVGPRKMLVEVGPNGEFEEPRYAIRALADGGTMVLESGNRFFLPFSVGGFNPDSVPEQFTSYNPGDPNPGRFNHFTIRGDGDTYDTVCDGRGGYGPGPTHPYALAYGKGWIYTQCPYTVQNINFIQCGGADLFDDGEAALRSESFAEVGWIDVQHCAFDRNENGIFIANNNSNGSPGINVCVRIDHCDFGMRASNGSTGMGLTHDLYVNGDQLEVTNSHFFGTRSEYSYGGGSSGNCIKSRARKVTIEDTWVNHGQGRCFDRPEGGETYVRRVKMGAMDGSVSNMIGYNNESDPNNAPQGAFDVAFENCTIYASRFEDTIWNDATGKTLDFSTTTVVWCKHSEASTPPSFRFTGVGNIVGLPLVPPEGTVFQIPPPAPPGSIAQPGYSPSWP